MGGASRMDGWVELWNGMIERWVELVEWERWVWLSRSELSGKVMEWKK